MTRITGAVGVNLVIMRVTATQTTGPLATSPVFITESIARRRPKKSSLQRDKSALLELASLMAETSTEVLPRLVELAMEVTGAVSAGLSVYDAETAPDIFRWQHLRGTLARFENATTPRDYSPCGVTLDRNGPVLMAHPERAYDWIAVEGLVLPEVLLVPLVLGFDEPMGTLWMVAGTANHFDRGDVKAATELAEFAGIALRMIRVQDRSRRAFEEQETVALEMSHRLKNIFAVTDAMIRGTARHARTPAEMAESLSGRVQALASAQTLVAQSASEVGSAPATLVLRELIRGIVRAHVLARGTKAQPFLVQGSAVTCGIHARNGLGLIINELATNAVKYGALRSASGRVAIRWVAAGPNLTLTWEETGGPEVKHSPTRVGFGSTLIDRIVSGQFRGTVKQEWKKSGLVATLTLTLARLST